MNLIFHDAKTDPPENGWKPRLCYMENGYWAIFSSYHNGWNLSPKDSEREREEREIHGVVMWAELPDISCEECPMECEVKRCK